MIGDDGHLRDYTRDVMDGMERDLGLRVDWMAVEHANTDNPHVHVIVRGVREDGLDLKYMACANAPGTSPQIVWGLVGWRMSVCGWSAKPNRAD
jgi:hypothetical protein